ncbi:MAG TPA: DUF4350 domain-containing protein [Nocardioides sp.]|nr:DUF4350 domain-containing protein [Nocardioides sp.]
MTTAVSAPPASGQGRTGRTGRTGWRPNRWTFIIAAAALVSVGLTVWLQRGHVAHPGDLDPQNPGSNGAQAVARVLAKEGVDVRIARSADDLEHLRPGPDATVVVTSTDELVPSTVGRLLHAAAGATVVVVDPDQRTVRWFDRRQQAVRVAGAGIPATCTAGVGVPLDGLQLTVDGAVSYRGAGCFGSPHRSVLVRDGGVLLFGAGEALTNDQVLRSDDAAIALRLLGQRSRLIWYVPTAADAAPHELASASLLPLWIGPSLALVAVAVIGLLLWRARRLGPLSVEPLPAVVRAAETAYSRGRLYRRTGDRGHAAGILRRATQRSVVRSLRLDRSASEDEIAAEVAARLDLPAAYVAGILTTHGRVPTTDKELIGLAEELERIEREVRR